jgi:hypothetical protein
LPLPSISTKLLMLKLFVSRGGLGGSTRRLHQKHSVIVGRRETEGRPRGNGEGLPSCIECL